MVDGVNGGRRAHEPLWGKRWVEEFRAEIADDHSQLLAMRARKQAEGSSWSFAVAVARTQAFYRERIGGFARIDSVTPAEHDQLMALVEALGSERFPKGNATEC